MSTDTVLAGGVRSVAVAVAVAVAAGLAVARGSRGHFSVVELIAAFGTPGP
jgi:hypothetical protein